MSCPNCAQRAPRVPLAISLDSKQIAFYLTQWLGMWHGIPAGIELNITFSWGKEGLKAQVTEVTK